MAKKKWDENNCDNCGRLLKDHSFADVGRCSAALQTGRPDLASLPVAVWQYVADLEDERDSLRPVAEAARSYFQHHVSQAPHGVHVEAVVAALAKLDERTDARSGKAE